MTQVRPWSKQMVEAADGTFIIKGPTANGASPEAISVSYLYVERLAGSYRVFWEWTVGASTFTHDLVPTRSTNIELGPQSYGKHDDLNDNNEANGGTLKLTVSGTGSVLLWARGLLEPVRLSGA